MYLSPSPLSFPPSVYCSFFQALPLSLSRSVPPSLASALPLPLFLSVPLLWLLQLVAIATEGLSSFRQQWSGARGCHHPTLFPSFSLSLPVHSLFSSKCSHLSHPSYSCRFILPIFDCSLAISITAAYGTKDNTGSNWLGYSIPAVIDLQTSCSKYQSDRNMLPLKPVYCTLEGGHIGRVLKFCNEYGCDWCELSRLKHFPHNFPLFPNLLLSQIHCLSLITFLLFLCPSHSTTHNLSPTHT